MKKNFAFFILSAVLLIKQSLGDTKLISPSHEFTPNGKAFHNAVIAKLATLSKEPLKLVKKLYEETYIDKSYNENVTEILANALKYFDRIDLDVPAVRGETFLGFSFIIDIVSGRVRITNDEGKRELILAVKAAFEQHDVMGVANEFQRKFEEFMEWLTKELHAKSDTLTTEEQLRMSAFKELCLEFKKETDMTKKHDDLGALISEVKS